MSKGFSDLNPNRRMLNREETKRVYQHAYLPEYLIEYVESISDAKSHLHENYLRFFQKKHLILLI